MGKLIECDRCKDTMDYIDDSDFRVDIIGWWKGKQTKYLCHECYDKLEYITKAFIENKSIRKEWFSIGGDDD